MKKSGWVLAFVVMVAAAHVLSAGLVLQAMAAEPVEQQMLVDKARLTFQSFMRDDNFVWLRENLDQAKALLIVPGLLKGGFILGGSGGNGVLIVNDEKKGNWSQPGFYMIGSVTFGLQIGGEAAEVLMMVRSQRALEKLYTTSFKLGGDTSIAAGPVGAGAKTNVFTDIVSFARSKGAYAGLSLEGAVIATRDEWNEAYYGRSVRPMDIFVKHSVSNAGSWELRQTVAEAERAAKKTGASQMKGSYYVVERGDTLWEISQKYGVSVDKLRGLNNLAADEPIYPGQKLRLE
jgi:lipid-binding SYLF domain-containing protein